jgi:sugar lactone lactonase YvrE
MRTFRMFKSNFTKSAGSSLRYIAAIAMIAMLAVASGAWSPAWGKPAAASLWAGDTNNDKVVELTPSNLGSSGSPAPVILDSAGLGEPEGVAFDLSKNLWVSTFENHLVLEFTPAQLNDLGTVSNPTPAATINSTSFVELDGDTFDKDGNLWIVDYGANGVDELSKTQLNAGSNADITPAITITSSSLDDPNFDVFDKSGNLWVSSEDNSEIVEFAAEQLGSSGALTPKVVLSSNSANSLDEPGEMAFDSKGNLWVTNFDIGTVVMFAKKQLRASGSPTPKVTLSSSVFDGPWGLAFDRGHNLWVSNYNNGTIFKFRSKQLKKSGALTPPVILQGVLSGSYGMTFGPVF